MIRLTFVALGVGAVVLLGWLLEAQSQTPAPPPVALAGPLKIYAPGRVEGMTEEVALRPQMRGQVVAIKVREGAMVQVGDVLVQLDPAQFEHEVRLAEAELTLAQAERTRLVNGATQHERDEAEALHKAKVAEMELAKIAVARLRRLREQSAASQQELDDQESKLRSSQAQVQAAQSRWDHLLAPAREDEIEMCDAKIAAARSRLELARVSLERTAIRAIAAGQILNLNVEPGEITGPDSVEPAVILVDTSRYRVRAFVDEIDAPRLRVGMPATVVADGLPDQQFRGKVARLSPRMSAKQIWNDDPGERSDTKVREIWIDLDSASSLVVGLRVDVAIEPVAPATAHIEG